VRHVLDRDVRPDVAVLLGTLQQQLEDIHVVVDQLGRQLRKVRGGGSAQKVDDLHGDGDERVAELRQHVGRGELRDDLVVEDRVVDGADQRLAVREVTVERGDTHACADGDLLQ
jgi:hypothetical protein